MRHFVPHDGHKDEIKKYSLPVCHPAIKNLSSCGLTCARHPWNTIGENQ